MHLKNHLIAIVAALLAIACIAGAAPAKAQASTLAAASITAQSKGYSTQENSYGYVTTASNGKTSYYVSDNDLYKKNLSTGKVSKEKALPKGSGTDRNYWSLEAANKGSIYLNMTQTYGSERGVYRFDTKTKKLTKVLNGCVILEQSGRLMIANARYHRDTSANTYVLYKVKGGKLKKVKTIAKYGSGLTVIGKKIYFAQGTNTSLDRNVRLYRASFKGAGKKLLGGPWKGNSYTWSKSTLGQVLVRDITATNCKVMKGGSTTKHYLYTYKTKKLKLLSSY